MNSTTNPTDIEIQANQILVSLAIGSPLSVFILAVEIGSCLIFILSIPSTKKDAILGLIFNIFTPFILITILKSIYTILLYYSSEMYYNLRTSIELLLEFSYHWFIYNYGLGICYYSIQSVWIAKSNQMPSRFQKRFFYSLVFVLSILLAIFNYIRIILYLFIPLCCVLCSILSLISVIIFKPSQNNDHIQIRDSRSRTLWIIPCLALGCVDGFVKIFINRISEIIEIMEFILPVVIIILTIVFLPSLRRSIFHCCYESGNDMEFILSGSSEGSSDRTSISTISNTSYNCPQFTNQNSNSIVPAFQIVQFPIFNSNQSNGFLVPIHIPVFQTSASQGISPVQ